MNWLAHVLLSEPNVEFRLGNLLADIVRGDARAAVGPEFLRGARRHHAIDAFTDAHPIVRRSRARVSREYRRFSGVLVDVFYDHCLARAWDRYASVPLRTFTSDFYSDVQASSIALPAPARLAIDRIIEHDLLSSYVDVRGVTQALRGISMRLTSRWHREFALQNSVGEFVALQPEFAADFAQFFPELRAHITSVG